MRFLLPNFEFDDVLASGKSRLSPASRGVAEDLAPLFGVFAQPGDVCICPRVPSGLPTSLSAATYVSDVSIDSSVASELFPFGWTDSAREYAQRCGMPDRLIPSAGSVIESNSRTFSAAFDDIYVPIGGTRSSDRFGRICLHHGELASAIRQFEDAGFHEWIVKPQISHSGRNRITGRGQSLSETHQGWLRRNLQDGSPIYAEPRVRIDSEWGLQFEIRLNGRIEIVGLTSSVLMSNGQYVGSIFDRDQELTEEQRITVEHSHHVCSRVASAGYHGPLGIDSFAYFDTTGQRLTRMCSDINARVTMGRIALEFASRAGSGRFNLWRLFRKTDFRTFFPQWKNSEAFFSCSDVDVSVVSPDSVGDRPPETIAVLFSGDCLENVLTVGKSQPNPSPQTLPDPAS